jgi:hypothetical protein
MTVGQETDLSRYLTYSRPKLLYTLGKVLTELRGVTQEYFMLKGEETRAQAQAYINSHPGDNITTRNANAKVAGHEITATLYSVKNELEQLTIERDFIQLLLNERATDGEEILQESNNA